MSVCSVGQGVEVEVESWLAYAFHCNVLSRYANESRIAPSGHSGLNSEERSTATNLAEASAIPRVQAQGSLMAPGGSLSHKLPRDQAQGHPAKPCRKSIRSLSGWDHVLCIFSFCVQGLMVSAHTRPATVPVLFPLPCGQFGSKNQSTERQEELSVADAVQQSCLL